ncbi:MAG: epoxyqueuosine reductase, partial [Hyphomicrobiaceae bacterium]
GRVAAYALARDYHDDLGQRLSRLATILSELCGASSAIHVDGGPLVEKHLARRAGLGWYGRNTNILTKHRGSALLLGCLVTDVHLEPDAPFIDDHCGECRACVPACPTDALGDGPTIDARRCISYLTIEQRGPIAHELRPQMHEWVFGCDVCQDVCPWNETDAANHERQWPWLPGLLFLTEDEFRHRFRGTPLLRAKRRGLARNAAIVLANTGNPDAIPVLTRALLEHDEPLVRAHAAWGLAALAPNSAQAALHRALARERIPPVRDEIERALRG